MTNHNFKFSGGDILRYIAASWFISYSYYRKIDPNHTNWNRLTPKSVKSRIQKFETSKSYHSLWIQEILKMSDAKLNRNKIGLSAIDVKNMASQL